MDKSEHASLKKSLDQLEVDLIRFKQILRMESETSSPSRDANSSSSAATAAIIRRRHGTGSRVSPSNFPMTPEEGEMRLDGSTPSGGGGIHLETTSFTSLATGEANKNSLSVNNGTSNGGANNNNNTRHHTTLAVISLDTPVATDEEGEDGKMGGKSNGGSPNINGLKKLPGGVGNHGDGSRNVRLNVSPTAARQRREDSFQRKKNEANAETDSLCFWPFTLLAERPILRMFLVMFLNGLLSMLCSVIIMKIEKPAQDQRLEERSQMMETMEALKNNITEKLKEVGTANYKPDEILNMLDTYSEEVPKVSDYPEEIQWDMLSAQAFITSVQTTTGYGDIVPLTFLGKFFTIMYALVGIPVFMWYIVKLGVVFRLVVMKVVCGLLLCFCPGSTEDDSELHRISRRRSTVTRLKLLELNMRLQQQYRDDKRFHPAIIGGILMVFLTSIAVFISHMEGISYFDSFYAAFITYSCIGFGDIDIFKISYRSTWFNLLIYGNFIHILGYMILSAWISSLLEKCGVRKF